MIQLIIKLAVTLFAIWALWIFWHKDIDVKRLFDFKKQIKEAAEKQSSWIPEREQDAIYQNGKIVGRTIGEQLNEEQGVILFKEIYQSNDLDKNQEFDFRKWRLKIKRIEILIGVLSSAPQKGQIMRDVICEIKGKR